MFTNRRPPSTQFERCAPKPAPKAKPAKPAKPQPRWRATVEFRADGEWDTFTREVSAATRDEALDKLVALAEREYGGGWEQITRSTAVRLAR